MRNPWFLNMTRLKLFIILLFVISGALFLAVLPNIFLGKRLNIPGINKSIPLGNFVSGFSDIYISLGPLKIDREFLYSLGLDLEGGTRLTYQLDMSDIKEDARVQAFESARNVIERRINFFGVGEPVIQNLKIGDDYRIIIELP